MESRDGIEHINIYSKGLTPLGRALSNMFAYKFHFMGREWHSVEQIYQYLKAVYVGDEDYGNEVLASKNPFQAKEIGKAINHDYPNAAENCSRDKMFRVAVCEAISHRIADDEALTKLLATSHLPFEHYFVYRDKRYDLTKKYKWILDHIEFIRSLLT